MIIHTTRFCEAKAICSYTTTAVSSGVKTEVHCSLGRKALQGYTASQGYTSHTATQHVTARDRPDDKPAVLNCSPEIIDPWL